MRKRQTAISSDEQAQQQTSTALGLLGKLPPISLAESDAGDPSGKQTVHDALPETEDQAAAKESAVDESREVPALAEQLPEQSGKQHLPDDDEEEGEVEESEGEEDEQEEQEPAFTTEDNAEYASMMARRKGNELDDARIDRDVRRRKLWMLERGSDGSRKYRTYDQYCEECLGCTRQWVTQRTKWLASHETRQELRAKGHDVPEFLSPSAVSGLYQLDAAGGYQGDTDEDQEEAGLVAVLQEAQEEGASFTRDNLRQICERRAAYYRGKAGNSPLKAENYQQYKQDLALLAPLAGATRNSGLWHTAKSRAEQGNIPFEEALVEECKDRLALPESDRLLCYASGAHLQRVVNSLRPIAQGFVVLKEQEQAAKEAKAKTKELKAALGIRPRAKGKAKQEQPQQAPREMGARQEDDSDDVDAAPPVLEDRQTELAAAYGADPKGFLEDVILRLDVISGQAEKLLDSKQDVLLILPKIITATEIIECVLTDDAVQPEPVPKE